MGTRGDCRTLDRSPLGATGSFCKMGVSDCGGAFPGVYANGELCPGLPKDLRVTGSVTAAGLMAELYVSPREST